MAVIKLTTFTQEISTLPPSRYPDFQNIQHTYSRLYKCFGDLSNIFILVPHTNKYVEVKHKQCFFPRKLEKTSLLHMSCLIISEKISFKHFKRLNKVFRLYYIANRGVNSDQVQINCRVYLQNHWRNQS